MTTATNKQFLTRTGVLLPPGSTTQAPLTFQKSSPTGTNLLTTISAGSIEWDGYNFYVTELSTNTTYGANSYTSGYASVSVTGKLSGFVGSTSVSVSGISSTVTRQQLAYRNTTMLPPITTYMSAGLVVTLQTPSTVIVSVNGVDTTFDNLKYEGTYARATQIYTDIAHITSSDDPTGSDALDDNRKTNWASAAAGVILPPCVPGRKVTVINDTIYGLRIYPQIQITKSGVTSDGTTITLINDTTDNLLPGMQIASTGTGIGALAGVPRIVSILNKTQFVIDILPSTPFTVNNGSYCSFNFNPLSTMINNDTSYFSIQLQTMEFVANKTGNGWVLTGTAAIAKTNGPVYSDITRYSVLYADGSKPGGVTPVSATNTTGSVLISGGSNSAPKYGQVNLSTSNNMITGILPPENGGTGSSGDTLSSGNGTLVYNIMPSSTTVKVLNIGLGVPDIFIGNTASSSNVTINGNLVVRGVQETIISTTSMYSDSVLELQKAASGGWISTDPQVDVGLRFHEFGDNNIPFFQLSGTANTSNTIVLSDNITLLVDSVVTLYTATSAAGVTSGTAYAVSAVSTTTISGFTYNTVTLANTSATTLTSIPKTGYITRITNFSISAASASQITPASGINLAYVNATFTFPISKYPGTLKVNAVITVTGVTLPAGITGSYNGTWKITSVVTSGANTIVSVKIENIDQTKLPTGGANGNTGSIYLDDHYAFTGYEDSSKSFYFYKESLESTGASGASASTVGTGTVTGILGNIKGSTFVSKPAGMLSATDITAGMSLNITSASVIVDNLTVLGSIIDQAATVRIGKVTLDSYTTSMSFTNAASLYIEDAPAPTNNAKITNTYAIQVGSGNVLFGGNLYVNGGSLTALSVPTGNSGKFNLLNSSSVTGISMGTSSTNTYIGAPTATLEIGTTAGDGSTLSLASKTGGTVNIKSNNAGGASIFNESTVSSASLFAYSSSIKMADSVVGSVGLDLKFGNNVTAGTTMTIGGSPSAGNSNKLTIGGNSGATTIIDSGSKDATIALFPSNTSSVRLAELSPTLKLQTALAGNTSTYIGSQVSITSTTVVYIGGPNSTATSAIYLGASTSGGVTGKAVLDTTSVSGNGYIFPTITAGKIYYGDNATDSYFGSNISGTNSVVNLTVGVSASSSLLTIGSVTSTGTNTLKLSSKTDGTVKITTDVTTGSATIFETVSGSTTIGAATITTGSGNVSLGISPKQTANSKEVVTAEWVLNAPGAINTLSSTLSNSFNQSISIDITGSTNPGAFIFDKFRAAKYVIQATQSAVNNTTSSPIYRTQTSELLVTHDAPVVTYKYLGSPVSNTNTISISNAILQGILPGMDLSMLTSGTSSDSIPSNTFVLSTSASNITLNNNVTVSTNSVVLGKMKTPYDTGTLGTNLNAAAGTQIPFGTNVSTSKGVVYVGMVMTLITPTQPATPTLVASVTSGGFILNNTLTNVTRMIGYPQVFATEYGVVETNGTVATFNADVNTSSPYEILVYASTVTASNTTQIQTLFRMEKELIEIM